jgi:MFS family permease
MSEPSPTVATDTPAAPSLGVSSWPMWVLGMVIMLDQIDQNIVRGAATDLQRHFQVSDSAIGWLYSAFVVVNGLITVPAGYLADRWNRTRTIGHTVIAWSAITVITAAAGNFGILLALRGVLGFGQAITEPSAASALSDYYPTSQRGRVFSNQQVMGLLGAGLGIVIGGAIASNFGWRWAFIVVGPPGIVVALLAYTLREPPRGYGDKLHLGVDEWPEVEKVELFERGFVAFVQDTARGLIADFKVIWSIATLRYALVGVSALMFTVTGVGTWLPQFHQRFNDLTEKQATSAVGLLLMVGGVPGVLLGGRLADRFTDRIQGARVVIPAYCIGFGNLFMMTSYLAAVPRVASLALQLLGVFTITMAIPALRAGMADAVPAHLRGAGFGAFNLASIVFGVAAAPLIVGWLSDIWNLRAAFLIVSPPVFLGAYILYRAKFHLDADAMKIFEAVVRAMNAETSKPDPSPPDPSPPDPSPPDPSPPDPSPPE